MDRPSLFTLSLPTFIDILLDFSLTFFSKERADPRVPRTPTMACATDSLRGARDRPATGPRQTVYVALLDFYRRELNKLNWTEDAAQTQSDATSARLAFRSSSGPLSLVLKQDGDITQIELTTRNETKARQDKLVPAAGQGLLVFANAGDQEVAITLNKRQIKLPAGIGAQNPAKAVKVPVLPGKHLILLGTDDKAKREEVVVEAGTTWGVIAIPGGKVFAQILY